MNVLARAPTAGNVADDDPANPDRLRRIFGDQYLAHNDDLSAGIWGTTAQVKSAVVTPKLAESVSLEDFYAHMPSHQYIFMPTREPWPASSVNSRIGKVTAAGKDGKPLLDNAGKKIWFLRAIGSTRTSQSNR